MPRRNLRAIFVVAVLSLVCWRSSLSAKPRDEMMELYGRFVDAVEHVESSYAAGRPVSRKELIEDALRGMLQNLDEHSIYLADTDYKQFQKEIGESYAGIGVTITIRPRVEPFEDHRPARGRARLRRRRDGRRHRA